VYSVSLFAQSEEVKTPGPSVKMRMGTIILNTFILFNFPRSIFITLAELNLTTLATVSSYKQIICFQKSLTVEDFGARSSPSVFSLAIVSKIVASNFCLILRCHASAIAANDSIPIGHKFWSVIPGERITEGRGSCGVPS